MTTDDRRTRKKAKRSSGVATISDVATEAGVSVATVSRVMNGNPTVAVELATRVREVAQRFNYSPSVLGRNLSLGKTRTVALVVPDVTNPMFQEVLRGVTTAAAEDEYRVLIADLAENAAEGATITLDARSRCDAAILVSPRLPETQLRSMLGGLTPAVVINRHLPGSGLPSLVVDHAAGVRDAIHHLHGLGHHEVAYVAGNPLSAADQLRRDGISAAQREFPRLNLQVLPGGAQIDDGYAAAAAVLASGATAVLCHNDLVAFGLMAYAREQGVSVPRDLSVIGFDDIQFARYAHPALTTLAAPHRELGARAWRELSAVIRGGTPSTGALWFAPQLVVRDSTAPPAPRSP